MAKTERLRDFLSDVPPESYFQERLKAGWRPVAIDWERDGEPGGAQDRREEPPPFGLEIAPDRQALTDHPLERQALLRMMELIVEDRPLGEVAEQLNRGGFRMRNGSPWNESALFDLLPRLIEAGPRILTDREYVDRKRRPPARSER